MYHARKFITEDAAQLLKDEEKLGYIRLSPEMTQYVIDALNFYEQHHTEHTCYVCDHTSTETKPITSETYVCTDPQECIRRANKRFYPS